MFDTIKYDKVFVKDVMHNPPAVIDIRGPDGKSNATIRFPQRLEPAGGGSGKYLGFVSGNLRYSTGTGVADRSEPGDVAFKKSTFSRNTSFSSALTSKHPLIN